MADTALVETGQDKVTEKSFYDELFARRGRFDQFGIDVYERMAALAREGTQGGRALDIGCGAGDLSLCLIGENFEVISADLSGEAVKLARGTVRDAGKKSSAINADAERLPLADASVDACMCSLLLHHFSDLGPIAREIHRVVKPGGVVVALDANGHNPFAYLFFNVVHRLRPLAGLTPNQRAIRGPEIEREFGKLGFHDFEFSSLSTALKKDWLGDSLGAKLNYYTRATVLGLTEALMPQINRGNCLLARFQRD
jgi:ubiquinone/menaquinone biosynthesis C-methylase UbiE